MSFLIRGCLECFWSRSNETFSQKGLFETRLSRFNLETAVVENQRLQADVKRCQNWLTSLSFFRLSEDVLFLIFDFCATSDDEPLTTKDASLWSISQTCRRWRDVALSQSLLWRHVYISGEKYSKDPMSMLRTWIERSRSVPLKVKVYLGEDDIEPQMMELLVDVSFRWCDVYLELNSRTDIYYWLARKGNSFPVLRDLWIGVGPLSDLLVDNEDWSPLEGSGFADAPNLAKARLSIATAYDHIPLSHIPTITLPWHQLRHFHCFYFGDAEFFSIGGQLCNLESFKIEFDHDTPPPFTNILHMTLPALRCLEVYRGSVAIITSLLGSFTLPVLDELRILWPTRHRVITTKHESELMLISVASLCTRSSCHLQNLQVEFEVFSSPNVHQIASPIIVQTLRLDICPWRQPEIRITSQALRNLRSGPIFRRLSSLHVVIPAFDEWEVSIRDVIIPAFADIVTAWRTVTNHFRSPTSLQLDLWTGRYPSEGSLLELEDGPLLDLFLELERGGLILAGSAFRRK